MLKPPHTRGVLENSSLVISRGGVVRVLGMSPTGEASTPREDSGSQQDKGSLFGTLVTGWAYVIAVELCSVSLVCKILCCSSLCPYPDTYPHTPRPILHMTHHHSAVQTEPSPRGPGSFGCKRCGDC